MKQSRELTGAATGRNDSADEAAAAAEADEAAELLNRARLLHRLQQPLRPHQLSHSCQWLLLSTREIASLIISSSIQSGIIWSRSDRSCCLQQSPATLQ